MKSIFLAATVLGMAFAGAAAESEPPPLVWCGLDYSMVKMIGTGDFRRPEEIFPGMLEKWNELFMKEMLPRLEALDSSLRTDLHAVAQRNSKAGASQIQHEDGTRQEKVDTSHITDADLAKAVRSYDLKIDRGLGLVFIVDRLVKLQHTGCLYVVFFDVRSRKVVFSERVCADAAGGGFRNYWFRPIKTAVEKLPAMYMAARSPH